MIVQCQNCRTKFNIDESLIKEEGTKVRCSQCENVFSVFPQEQIETEDAATEIPQQSDAGAEMDLTDDSLEPDLDFDESFEEDMLEDFEDLEAEYQKVQKEVSTQADDEALTEDLEETAAEEFPEDDMTDTVDSDKQKSKKDRTLLILVVIVLGLFCIAYAIFKFGPNLIPDSILPEKTPSDLPKTVDPGASRLEILTVEGSFTDSDKAGRLFVIKGKVRNSYSTGRSFILIKGCILNETGKVVMEKTAFAGNTFNEQELSSMPMEEISSAMENRRGTNDRNVNVNPGTTTDFMIVFDNLPDNMNEFTVGPVSSSPVDQKTEAQQ